MTNGELGGDEGGDDRATVHYSGKRAGSMPSDRNSAPCALFPDARALLVLLPSNSDRHKLPMQQKAEG